MPQKVRQMMPGGFVAWLQSPRVATNKLFNSGFPGRIFCLRYFYMCTITDYNLQQVLMKQKLYRVSRAVEFQACHRRQETLYKSPEAPGNSVRRVVCSPSQ